MEKKTITLLKYFRNNLTNTHPSNESTNQPKMLQAKFDITDFFFADLAKKVPIDNYVPENRDEVNTKPAEAGQSLLLRE